jgi:hypothetical protein
MLSHQFYFWHQSCQLQINLKENFKKEETAVWKSTELPSVVPLSLLLEEML